jgi:hypothetical protein
MRRIVLFAISVSGLLSVSLAQAQQFDSTSPFGRTVGSAARLDAALPEVEGAGFMKSSAESAASETQYAFVPTIVSAEDADIYMVTGGLASGANQLLVRYGRIDPEQGGELNQYFAQYKRSLNSNVGVFGFGTRTGDVSRDVGAAASFEWPLGEQVAVAGNLGYQWRDSKIGRDEDDLLARAGIVWQPVAWLMAAVDHEFENKINGTDSLSLEVTIKRHLFIGADTEESVWAGFSFLF